jgi:hypothetical protein
VTLTGEQRYRDEYADKWQSCLEEWRSEHETFLNEHPEDRRVRGKDKRPRRKRVARLDAKQEQKLSAYETELEEVSG